MSARRLSILFPCHLKIIAPRRSLSDIVLARARHYWDQGAKSPFLDEQVWTLLFAYGFFAEDAPDQRGTRRLAAALTGVAKSELPESRDWKTMLEMLPVPARRGVRGNTEGNTVVDLSVGDISCRENKAGIRFSGCADGWICFVEAKCTSDISTHLKHDLRRNQLARVIETALTFQSGGTDSTLPETVHVVMLAPEMFCLGNESFKSRLYQYKIREYNKKNRHGLLADIKSRRVSESFSGFLSEFAKPHI